MTLVLALLTKGRKLKAVSLSHWLWPWSRSQLESSLKVMCLVPLSLRLMDRVVQSTRFRNPADICYLNSGREGDNKKPSGREGQGKMPEDMIDTFQGRTGRGISRSNELLGWGSPETGLFYM